MEGQGHILILHTISPASIRCLSILFPVTRPSLSYDMYNIKGRLKSIARSTSVRCMELHDRKWCVEASNLKISVLPIVTRYVTIDTTHGCLGLIRQPHPRVIVMTGRASLVRECKQMTEWSSSGSSCGCRAVSGIPIPNSHHQVH